MRTSEQKKYREYYKVTAELRFRFIKDQTVEQCRKIERAMVEAGREHPWIDEDKQGRQLSGVGIIFLEDHYKVNYSVGFHISPHRHDMERSQVYAYERCLREIGEKVSEKFLGLQEFEVAIETKRLQLCNKTIRKISDLPVSTLMKNAAHNMGIYTVAQLLMESMRNVNKWRTIGYGSLAQLITVLIDDGWREGDGVLLTGESVSPYFCRSEFYIELQEMNKRGQLSREFKRWFNEMISNRNEEIANRPNRKVFIKPFNV